MGREKPEVMLGQQKPNFLMGHEKPKRKKLTSKLGFYGTSDEVIEPAAERYVVDGGATDSGTIYGFRVKGDVDSRETAIVLTLIEKLDSECINNSVLLFFV